MLGVIGRLLPWVIILGIWFALNRALDRMDAQRMHGKANKFFKRIYFLWGWIFGIRSWLTALRYLVTGVLVFLLFRWLAVSISTPFP